MEQRFSDNEVSKRDIPSFIEPRPPLISNPFMRPRPQKGTNLLKLFEEDSELEEPELVQVYLRMKPYEGPNDLYEIRSDKCLVASLDTATAGHGRRTQHNVSRMYTFSKIFDAECSQKKIFDEVVKENLKKLVEGNSFTLLTYGASGSGKTYTLMGTVANPGLVPRSLEYVFKLVEAAQLPLYKPSDSGTDQLGYHQQDFELQWVKKLRKVSAAKRDKYRRMSAQLTSDLTVSTSELTTRTKYYVWVSFVEIYNEAIYDLLAPPEKRVKLRMREDASGQVYVKGVTQAFVRTGAEAYDVMVAGTHNLVVAATGVHAHSSRSHCIFTITMLTETNGEIGTSCVRLCDLAGCERARATRNTGARMQESRAINSSLHVLERCLHMLRRNQRQRQEVLVPYRESKLTRLLGSGLSGSHGEAVSMVVTLNPAPLYAHETKHVLSLAAVAQDIQINNTAMYASTLETTQDTTIAGSAEVMKLRADNELLQFELAQAIARNKELLATMDEKRNAQATLMMEVVEEAKDMTREYYESQLAALRNEMEDMKEEYEARLAERESEVPVPPEGTPNRFLQAKVAQLMTEITVLQHQLSEEREAKLRSEEEVKHLWNCIHERDEVDKAPEDRKFEEVEVITDSEDDSSDPLNQSLEPAFRAECINRSQVTRKHIPDTDDASDESTDTITQNSEFETGDESYLKDANETFDAERTLEKSIHDVKADVSDFDASKDISKTDDLKVKQSIDDNNKTNDVKTIIRGTYFVQNLVEDSPQAIVSNKPKETDVSVMDQDNAPNDSIEKNDVRGTYFVRKSAIDDSVDEGIEDKSIADNSDKFKEPEAITKSNVSCNEVRGTYFVRNSAIDTSNDDVSDEDKETETEQAPEEFCPRTSAIDTSIDEEMQEVIEHKSICEDISINKSPRVSLPSSKVTETLVSKNIQSLKKSTHSNVSDSSLEQFEQLERQTKASDDKINPSETIGEIKMLKEKKKYFDESTFLDNVHVKTQSDQNEIMISSNVTKTSIKETDTEKRKGAEVMISCNKTKYSTGETVKDEQVKDTVQLTANKYVTQDDNLITIPVVKKRTYNIEVIDTAPNKMVSEIINSARKNHDRSPSIVSDDSEPSEPSTMKKLLGENMAKLEVPSTISKMKKQESMDVFDDSPKINLNKIPLTPNKVASNLDNDRVSIEKLVLSQKSICDKQENKLKTIPSVDETDNKDIKDLPKINLENIEKSADTNETQKKDNTIDEFENIYKNISTHRPTEFDLLATTQEIEEKDKAQNIKSECNKENIQKQATEPITLKYNLRHKSKGILNTSDDKKVKSDEVLLESTATCESKRNKRCLRLRRRKNDDDSSDQDDKLKDILNLKKEFSDVTLGLPAVTKEVKDIPSPEKLPGDVERPMLLGIQSCPSKSVQRSRRKLFTPRAEPLDESLSQAGDSSERVYVPRPSYHRPRARRKL